MYDLYFDTGDVYYTASDHSDEDIQHWAASSQVPKFHDNDSATNQTHTLLRFVIREVIFLCLEDHSVTLALTNYYTKFKDASYQAMVWYFGLYLFIYF